MIILLNFYIRYFIYVRRFIREVNLKKFWHLHNGDWHWLKEKPVPIASINRSLWRASVPSFSFYFMLGLSAIISTLGLLVSAQYFGVDNYCRLKLVYIKIVRSKYK